MGSTIRVEDSLNQKIKQKTHSLSEESNLKIKIPSGTPKVDKLVLSDIDDWSKYNIWSVKQPLYMIEDLRHQDGIVLTLKQIRKLIPELQKIDLSHKIRGR